MTLTQAELDDLLEDLIAYTDVSDPQEQVRRLSRLCLLLIDACGDRERVLAAMDAALAAADPPVVREID